MPELVRQRVSLGLDAGSRYTSLDFALPALTDVIEVRLARPTTLRPLAWNVAGRVRISIIIVVDGVEHRCDGSATGGIRSSLLGSGEEIAESVLSYNPTWGFFGARGGSTKRLGETSRSEYKARVELTLLSGSVETVVKVTATESPAPAVLFHSSVAYDNSTSAKEEGGDGVISFSHTATGSDLGIFVGGGSADASGPNSSTGATYDGTSLTEAWDLTWGSFSGVYGYHWPGGSSPPTGTVTVTQTTSTTSPERHACGVISMTGVDQTTPVGTAVSANGSTSPATVTVTGLATDGMVVDTMLTDFNSTITVGADQTQWETQTPSFGGVSVHFRQSTQSSNDGGVMSWTLGGSSSNGIGWGMGAIEFKPVTAGGGVNSNFFMFM